MKMPNAANTEPLTREAQIALLDRALAGRSLAELRERLGIAERTLRCYRAEPGPGFVFMPYAVRYLVEVIASANGHAPSVNVQRSRGTRRRRVPTVRG